MMLGMMVPASAAEATITCGASDVTSNIGTVTEVEGEITVAPGIKNWVVPKTFVVTVTNSDEVAIKNSFGKAMSGLNTCYLLAKLDKAITKDLTKKATEFPTDFTVTKDQLLTVGYSNTSFDTDCVTYHYIAIKNKYAVLIQVKQGELDKAELNTAIAQADTYKGSYYDTDDRYNGKTTATELKKGDSINGLPLGENAKDEFSDYFDAAKAVAVDALTNTTTQSAVDQATTWLTTTTANLILKDYVNPTELYELVNRFEKTDEGYKEYESLLKSSDYTASTWKSFEEALGNAQTMLDDLYNEDGSPSNRNWGPQRKMADPVYDIREDTQLFGEDAGSPPADAITNTDVNDAVTALRAARADLLSTRSEESLSLFRKSAAWLLEQQAALTEADYTGESWSTWTDACQALLAADAAGQNTNTQYLAYTEAVAAASTAYYGLVDRKDSITVHVRVTDDYGAAKPSYVMADKASATYAGDVVLTGDGKTIGGLVAAMNFDDRPGTGYPSATTWLYPKTMAYVNGVLTVNRTSDLTTWSDEVAKYGVKPFQLHDGDDIVLVRTEAPSYGYYISNLAGPYVMYYTYAGLLEIGGADVVEVPAGEAFTLSVTKTPAAAEATSKVTAAASDVTLFLSDGAETKETAAAAPALTNTGTVTDADGMASLALYAEGWYRLAAVNVTPQTLASTTDSVSFSGGSWPHLAGGDYILVHVTQATDEAAVRRGLQTSLDEVYQQHGEDFYGAARWAEVQSIYQEATSVISGEVSEKPKMGDAAAARDEAVSAINNLIDSIKTENATVLGRAADLFTKLPDSVENFTQAYQSTFGELKTLCDGMTAYQRSQLTGFQAAKYERLLNAYGEDGSNLPDARKYKVTVNTSDGRYEDGFSLFCRITAQDGTTEETCLQTGVTHEYTFVEGASIAIYLIPTPPAGTTVGRLGEYSVNRVEISGDNGEWITNTNTSRKVYVPFEAGSQNKAEHPYAGLVRFTNAGFDDITVTVTVRKTGVAETLDEAKTLAKEELAKAYAGYKKSFYSTESWQSLTNAYNSGVDAIDAAVDNSGIIAAQDAAMAAMAAVKTMQQEKPALPTVGDYGTVHVIVENTTYKEGAFTGTIVDADVALNEDDTMMTVILAALQNEGYGWTGTGGSQGNKNDTTITYLSSITKNGQTLGEFSGSAKSGWMGTLNDWFTNEGFRSFAVTAKNRDYRLADGDEIRVMYTDDLGADLGGTWGDADTTLAGLGVSGGTLAPAFDGDQTSYTLMPTGRGISLEPAAANKNYQVRIYLNEKSGENWYRRNETIPAKAGDTIYVGVGERSWPSMNNQGDEAIPYTGTWYTIKVVDSSSADSVIDLIKALPTVTYSNYKDVAKQSSLARSAYDALSAEAKTKVINLNKLEKAEERIKFFEEIDNVKTLLDKIPAASKLTTSDKSKVQAARNAYDRLSEEQKLYITLGDLAKFNAAVEWLEKQGISTGGAITKDRDAEAVSEVIALIDAIGTVTKDSGSKIAAARTAYDALTDAQKRLVSNYEVLTDAEAEFERLGLPTVACLPFTDVSGHWALEAIQYVYDKGLMGGTSDTTFAPDVTLNRSMLATILYRLEGEPAVNGSATYTDVAADAYYAKAVSWATENKIVSGYGNGFFGPADNITREQMAAMLYRYASYKGYDVSRSGDLKVYTDADSIGSWAVYALRWANAEGLINGRTSSTLVPAGTATRAEAATILMRFCQRYTLSLPVKAGFAAAES